MYNNNNNNGWQQAAITLRQDTFPALPPLGQYQITLHIDKSTYVAVRVWTICLESLRKSGTAEAKPIPAPSQVQYSNNYTNKQHIMQEHQQNNRQVYRPTAHRLYRTNFFTV